MSMLDVRRGTKKYLGGTALGLVSIAADIAVATGFFDGRRPRCCCVVFVSEPLGNLPLGYALSWRVV